MLKISSEIWQFFNRQRAIHVRHVESAHSHLYLYIWKLSNSYLRSTLFPNIFRLLMLMQPSSWGYIIFEEELVLALNPGYKNGSFIWSCINLPRKFYILLKNLARLGCSVKKNLHSMPLFNLLRLGHRQHSIWNFTLLLHIAWEQWILGPNRLQIKILQHDDKLKLMRWQTWWKRPRRTSALTLDLSLQNLVYLRKLLWAVDLLRGNDNHILVSIIWKTDLNLWCQSHFPTSHGNYIEFFLHLVQTL